MRNCDPNMSNAVTRPMRLAAATVVLATMLAGAALAQGTSAARPKAPAQAVPQPAAAAPAVVISKAPEPTFDEGTALRIAAAMLSYSAIEVRGGWPTLPASVAKLGPGTSGPDVAALRQRLAMTVDLPAPPEAAQLFEPPL